MFIRDRLKELEEHYIYGDFDTGKIWSFKYDSGKVHSWSELADTSIRLVSFLEQSDGEILLVDYASGLLHELVKAPPVTEVNEFPTLLSETGLFRDTAKLLPEDGVLSYLLILSLVGSCHEVSALSNSWKARSILTTYLSGNATGSTTWWRFPDGTV